MYIIRKEFHFSASHCLDHLPSRHPCAKVHGHNYIVTIELRSKTLNEHGFVKDYRELDNIKQFIDQALDHKHLNDFFDQIGLLTTSEHMAKHLFELFKESTPELYAVEVSETPKTNCRYEGK